MQTILELKTINHRGVSYTGYTIDGMEDYLYVWQDSLGKPTGPADLDANSAAAKWPTGMSGDLELLNLMRD